MEWVAASNVGINRLLFPALVESDVPLTNARGAADEPIAETVVGFVVAMAKGFRSMFDRQRAHVVGAPSDGTAGRDAASLVVGPGPIGRAIGRALRDGLGMQVEAVGRTGRAGDDLFEIDPRRRRAACGAGRRRLRDRRHAADAADRATCSTRRRSPP